MKDKILVIGVYRDGTGWGNACRDIVLALDAAGADVVCRPFRHNNNREQLHPRLLQLENKSSLGSNIVIQYVLPHHFDFNGHFDLNIGLYLTETSDFKQTGWVDRINSMDVAWVYNQQSKKASIESGVRVPIRVVPNPLDMSRFERSYQKIPIKDTETFLFYTIGEPNRRKNLAGLLRAFFAEFHAEENVKLVIKTSGPKQKTEEFVQQIMDGVKPASPPEVIILTDRFTEDSILGLHATCDVFVQPSFGEAWSLPAMDAMAMGKTPIVSASTGYLEYIDNSVGWLIECREEPVFGATDTFYDLHTGYETWFSPDLLSLRKAMREAFSNGGLREEKAKAGISRAYDFSYEQVGTKLLRVIQDEKKFSLDYTP